jgi:hypothetical protein
MSCKSVPMSFYSTLNKAKAGYLGRIIGIKDGQSPLAHRSDCIYVWWDISKEIRELKATFMSLVSTDVGCQSVGAFLMVCEQSGGCVEAGEGLLLLFTRCSCIFGGGLGYRRLPSFWFFYWLRYITCLFRRLQLVFQS